MPGMFVRADIVKKVVKDAIVIPLYSVISRNDEQFVFVAEQGTVSKRPVHLGIMEQWQVEVVNGLAPGEQVVIEGHRELEDGQTIKAVRVVNDAGELLL